MVDSGRVSTTGRVPTSADPAQPSGSEPDTSMKPLPPGSRPCVPIAPRRQPHSISGPCSFTVAGLDATVAFWRGLRWARALDMHHSAPWLRATGAASEPLDLAVRSVTCVGHVPTLRNRRAHSSTFSGRTVVHLLGQGCPVNGAKDAIEPPSIKDLQSTRGEVRTRLNKTSSHFS